MKLNRALLLIISFTGSMSLAYFWEDWGKRTTPEEKMKKEEIDLKYRQKTANVEYKEQKSAEKAAHKKQELELQRKKSRLKVERN